ncbi:uncharacterized protein LOC131846498 [Achroia grisella]|uniref:uncharacterized protein LOC131846498 n=1 Tax=Achroia grisella TaxID=688607 RepID=UPI0027D22522|nr:uncharacterized protein LOC131846498 [Achroia grisella]
MFPVSENYISKVVNLIINDLNITEGRYSLMKFEAIAQNYFGVIVPVVITGKRKENEVSLDIVLKVAPTDERFRVSGALTQFFAKEIYVYSTILRKYQEFQNDMPLVMQYIMPKCYYISKEYCNEVISMQNMCKDGYQPYTQNMFLDIDHVKVALISLAKFHALSFIMREWDPKLYEETKSICLPLSNKTNKRFMDILLDRLHKVTGIFEHSSYDLILENMRNNCAYLVESVACSVKQMCICHGDIWKENILFKYVDNKPIGACLIDYQTVRMASPAFDILFLITTSTHNELRRKYYQELLDTYYQTFIGVLNEANLDSHTLYSREMFEEDLKIVAPGCFIVANTALWLSNGLQQEGHVRSKHILTTDEEKEVATNKYKSVIKNILDDFICYGYLSL